MYEVVLCWYGCIRYNIDAEPCVYICIDACRQIRKTIYNVWLLIEIGRSGDCLFFINLFISGNIHTISLMQQFKYLQRNETIFKIVRR